MELDDFDQRIIRALQADGRISNLDLAKRIGLSPTPCSRRVRRLEDAGVIERYAAIVNPAAVGLDVSVFVSVRLEKRAAEPERDFADIVQDIPEIFECYLVTGDYDYILKVRTASVDGFKTFILDTLTKIPGVAETSTRLIIEDTKTVAPHGAVTPA